MATFTNQTKNSTSFTNVPKGLVDLTIDEADWTIDEAEGSIDTPLIVLSKQTKNTTSFTNQTKN